MSRHVRSLQARLAAVLRDERGVSAVEFALILPVFLAFYIAFLYYADTTTVQNKVSRAASALATTAAMTDTITDSQMAAMMSAARAVMDPVQGDISLVLSSVVTADDVTAVRWSDASGAAPLAVGDPFAFDGDSSGAFGAVTGKNVLVVDVTLTHASTFARVWNALALMPLQLSSTTVFHDRVYALPVAVTASPTPGAPLVSTTTARVLTSGEVLQ